MATCPCCCTNRTPDGSPCICEDYTQILIEVPGLADKPNTGNACGCTAAVLVADFVNETQEFAVDNCGGGYPDYVARYRVLPTLCGFVDCKHVGPGISGALEFFTAQGVSGFWTELSFFEGLTPSGIATASGAESNTNEPCGDFADRYNWALSESPTVELPACNPVIGGSWTLQ